MRGKASLRSFPILLNLSKDEPVEDAHFPFTLTLPKDKLVEMLISPLP